jgi:hypothetical protein
VGIHSLLPDNRCAAKPIRIGWKRCAFPRPARFSSHRKIHGRLNGTKYRRHLSRSASLRSNPAARSTRLRSYEGAVRGIKFKPLNNPISNKIVRGLGAWFAARIPHDTVEECLLATVGLEAGAQGTPLLQGFLVFITEVTRVALEQALGARADLETITEIRRSQ